MKSEKKSAVLIVLALSAALAAGFIGCNGNESGTDAGTVAPGLDAAAPGLDASTIPPDASGFTPPVGHVGLTFEVDDSANKTFTTADNLEWKGELKVTDATARTVAEDTGWAGPFPTLYDDGAYTAGGHEPVGATAGDNKWSTIVWFPSPQVAVTIDYGCQWGGSNWIWSQAGGGNGAVNIPANATGVIKANGLVLPAFGTVDFKLTIDKTAAVAANPAFVFTTVKVKGSAWGWSEVTCTDDATKGDDTAADNIFTFVLSANPVPHAGLVKTGDQPQFVFVLTGVEYKGTITPGTGPLKDGVHAYTKAAGGQWVDQTANIGWTGTDNNTYITVP